MSNSVLNVKAVVAASFNQEKALVGAFSVIVQLHRLIVYRALIRSLHADIRLGHNQESGNTIHCPYTRTASDI